MITRNKFLTVILLLLIVSYSSYHFGNKNSTSEEIETNQEESVKCPYTMDGGVNKDYFNINNKTEIMYEPQIISDPEVIMINDPFNEEEFKSILYEYPRLDTMEERVFDVNGDDDDERIITGDVAMNHTPHIALIVEGGQVVFKADGANIRIDEVFDGQGFLLSKTIDWNTGEREIKRYIYHEGGYMLAWTQKACGVVFE